MGSPVVASAATSPKATIYGSPQPQSPPIFPLPKPPGHDTPPKATKHGSPQPSQSPILPLPKPPGHDYHSPINPKKTRHVSFSSPEYSLPRHHKEHKNRSCFPLSFPYSSCCCCFQYTCLTFLGILFLILLFIVLFITFFHSKHPEIKIERLTIPRLKLSSIAQQSYLFAEVDLYINSFNNNEKIGIIYGDTEVSISSDNIELGQGTIPEFFQNYNNMTVLKVNTEVSNSLVDNQDGARLKADFDQKSLVLDVVLNSNIGLTYGSFKFKGLPVLIKCSSIKLSSIAQGIEPKCDLNIFILGNIF
ncbi:uncharacterized protein LOC122056970 [Macadamia integrifolia]|uniref:uncharacterized protein LOC122056970 n=1 Tax=Macadamia integrifolia TaxID=60698 RepID=UPI001C529F32|nr:uncharacterized protein LOC122056970 [Macadamia integrifolia]